MLQRIALHVSCRLQAKIFRVCRKTGRKVYGTEGKEQKKLLERGKVVYETWERRVKEVGERE